MSVDENQEVGTSLVDLIKKNLAELASNVDVKIPVTGWDSIGLAVKYVLPESGKVLDEIARKNERENKDLYWRNYNTAVDTMIALHDGLYIKLPSMDDYEILDPGDTGVAVRFDDRFAATLGLEAGSRARVIVKKMFGGNELAVLNHVEKLSRWLSDTGADLNLELWQVGN